MRRTKKRKVNVVVEREYWDGFFDCLGGREEEVSMLCYPMAPDWYNEAARIAFREGVRSCKEVLAQRDTGYFHFVEHEIPDSVFAKVYGATI